MQELPFKPGEGDEWLAARQLKIVVDGGILAGTAYMREPYGLDARALYGVDDPAYRGFLTLTREQIASAIAIGHRHGWQMVAHVTGDAGVDAVLDAIEAAQATPTERARPDLAISKDRRHTLLHAYFANAATAARAARLGVPIDTQPAWYYKDADALLPALGAPRLEHFIGIRTWLDAGAHVAINTDHMFGLDPNTSLNPFNPFLTIATAVTRRTEGGQVIGPNETITRQQALRMMTIEAARLSFDEARKGSIEVGKLADLTMLSDPILTVPDTKIRSITSDLTVVGGRITLRAAAADGRPPRCDVLRGRARVFAITAWRVCDDRCDGSVGCGAAARAADGDGAVRCHSLDVDSRASPTPTPAPGPATAPTTSGAGRRTGPVMEAIPCRRTATSPTSRLSLLTGSMSTTSTIFTSMLSIWPRLAARNGRFLAMPSP